MDDDSSMRSWGSFYDPAMKSSNLGNGGHGLQLITSLERETKPHLFFSNGSSGFSSEPTVPSVGFMRDIHFLHPYRDSPSTNPNPGMHHSNHVNRIPQYYDPPMVDTSMTQTLQILNPDGVTLPEITPLDGLNDNPKKKKKKKKPQGEQVEKQPKPKKPKKEASSSDGTGKKERNKDGEMERILINGMEVDLAKLPTPVCSCTGSAQQCYRWGVGGWQSACCTNTISMYPLPLSDKRRGARIAGRKMSLGAFRKVLERIAGEGIDLSQPIDLRNFWAKHGTNKFVTIR